MEYIRKLLAEMIFVARLKQRRQILCRAWDHFSYSILLQRLYTMHDTSITVAGFMQEYKTSHSHTSRVVLSRVEMQRLDGGGLTDMTE